MSELQQGSLTEQVKEPATGGKLRPGNPCGRGSHPGQRMHHVLHGTAARTVLASEGYSYLGRESVGHGRRHWCVPFSN